MQPGPYYADRVDEILTVFRSDEEGKIIGVQIKGVRRLPKHDHLILGVNSEKDVVMMLLLSFQKLERPELAEHYFDALEAIYGRVA